MRAKAFSQGDERSQIRLNVTCSAAAFALCSPVILEGISLIFFNLDEAYAHQNEKPAGQKQSKKSKAVDAESLGSSVQELINGVLFFSHLSNYGDIMHPLMLKFAKGHGEVGIVVKPRIVDGGSFSLGVMGQATPA